MFKKNWQNYFFVKKRDVTQWLSLWGEKRERFYFEKVFKLVKVKKITGLNPIKLVIGVSLSLNTIIWSVINHPCCFPLQSK